MTDVKGGPVSPTRPDGLIELPDGSRIFYDDSRHAYYKARYEQVGARQDTWVRSTRLTSASTLCKPYSFNADRLLSWKERMTCEGVAKLYAENPILFVNGEATSLEWLLTGDGIREKLKSAALTADDVRDRKADVGTRAHGVLEALAAGETPEAADGYGQAVINWWRSRHPVVLNCEQFVYSATHGYAGRFDLRCIYAEDITYYYDGVLPMGKVRLIDLKSSSWLAPSYHVQLELYELGAKECGVGVSDERIILQVKDDGTYREVPCRATEQDALNAIAVYRGAGRIERESGLPRAA